MLALLLMGCGEDGTGSIVARVGEVEIEQAEFEAFVERLPPGLRSPKEGRAADREHLQSMIDEELMFAEARSLGIDTSTAVAHQLREMVRQRLVERYRAQVIVPQVEITAEDVERAFVEMGFDRERLFSRILVRTREELEAVGRDLREGQPFEQVAARFAANDLFAAQGDGVVGWIGRTQAARRFSISPTVFTGLPVGQVAEPVALAGGYQVFRFIEDRPTALADYSAEVAERLRKERTREKEEEEFERLRVSYDVRLDPEGEAILLQSLDRPLTTDELNHPFYTYEGGAISVAEGLGSLQAVGAQGALQDEAAERVGRLLLPVRLFEAEARKRGWTEAAAFVEWREHQRRALILNQLFQQATAGAAPSEDEIRAHYEAHKDRYRTQEAVIVHELWTAEEEDAAALRAEWEAGVPVADLLDRPGVRSHAGVEGHGVREHGWEMRLLRLYEPRYPELVKAAFAAEVGALVGPLESMDGYAVFRVLRREGGQIQPFAEARRRAAASLRRQRENERIGAFIRQLQDKYKDQVAVLVDWD
ncbi:MAG: peptidyl-prolyl cis-trans isomerase [Gemmatimonadetes bacterium]|nr:peptidyl-prolyl cis-trans isomerase [Gemmatimonadota bacterium]